MSRSLQVTTEQMIDLAGLPAGAAAERVVELAKAQGYTVAATGPGVYRLARTRRRMLIDKRTESAVVTVFADRTGTKVRIVGAIDQVLLDHLRQAATAATSMAPPVPPIVSPPPAPSNVAPPASLPQTSAPRPAQPVGESRPIVSPSWTQPPAGTNGGVADDRTIARSAIRPKSASLTLPDGRTVTLDQPLVVGRNPDPALGPPTAVPLTIGDPSMSKTHATISLVDGAVWVTDLHSTNGTSIESNGTSMTCVAGQRRRAEIGSTIVAGDVRLAVRGDA